MKRINRGVSRNIAVPAIGIALLFSSSTNAAAPAGKGEPSAAHPPEHSVRGNEPLSPDEQTTTLDTENLFSRSWRGFRKYLAEKGVQIDPIYKGEAWSPISGGTGRKTVYLGNFDLKVNVNAEKLIGWKGATFFFYGLYDHGGRPSGKNVGDAQGVSNIEVVRNAGKIYELWVQQAFYDEQFTLLAGLHDLNSEFYVTETSSLFINSSFGVGRDLSQTGVNGPSIFPVTSLALRARYQSVPYFYLQSAVFNAVAGAGNPSDPRGTHASLSKDDGILSITEAAFLPNRGVEGKEHGKFAAGTWNYSKTFDHQTAVDAGGNEIQDSSHGFYLLGEHTFAEKFSAFLRFGKASSSVNRFSSNLSGGIVATGLIPGRPDDRFGLAATQVRNGREYREAQEAAGTPALATETAYEATYRLELRRGLALQLDYQHVVHPNTDPLIENAQIFGTRFEIAF